jgi:hypothetical protein
MAELGAEPEFTVTPRQGAAATEARINLKISLSPLTERAPAGK